MKISKRTRFASIFLALVMLISLLPSAAFAEDTSAIYVSSSGSDTTGNGTEETPYATISKAYSAVTSGGTIYLLSDVDVSSQIIFNSTKTVTITSSGDRKTINSKVTSTRYEFNSNTNGANTTFTNVILDGSGQTTYPGAITMSAGTITLGEDALIQNYNFPDDANKSHTDWISGVSVIYLQNGAARLNISGATITDCKIERGYWDNPSAIITVGSGATVYMTSGTITGNSLQTYLDTTSGQERRTAIINVGRYSNPHFWMTGGTITDNDIGYGYAAVYMRGEAKACDIEFGDTAYVYDNQATDGSQRNIYLKNITSGSENSNIYIKLCSALTGKAKLGVYAETIGMATKVAQGGGINGGSYTATAEDSTYFVSDKATDAEILYCGGDAATCGLLQHRTGTTHEKAIYLSTSPEVTATKNETNEDEIDLSIARCDKDATYVVLDKNLKPVTGKEIAGGSYVASGNGTFKLTNSEATTTIEMPGLSKDSGPYTVMLVSGNLSVDSDGKADTSSLTDIATVNIVNFAGAGVTWSAGENSFANGEFDIVTVPHNDQTGKAIKSYTAAAKTNFTFAADNAITASGNLGELTATKETDAEKYNVSVTVPAYGTTSKGTTNYNTVTITGATVMNSGVKLKNTADAGSADMTVTDDMASKTYDGAAVAHSEGSVDGATLSYTWQKVTKSADGTTTYEDLTKAPSNAGEYNLKITATSNSDSSKVLGTENLPFTINKKTLTVTATANDKIYDGGTTATLKSATLNGLVEADKSTVTLGAGKITVTFKNKNAGDSKAVTATVADGALTGDKAGNYTITSAEASNAKISPKTITATITAENKEYNGSAEATVSTPTLTGVLSGDNVSATASNPVFVGGSDVGNNKMVSADITLSGDDASNYTLSKSTASATANITAKTLNVTVSAENKAYDGTTDAEATVTLADASGIVGNDVVTLDDSSMKANFADATVGTNKTVTVTGLKLDGDSAENYKLPDTITATANITQSTSGVGTVTLDGWTYGDEANTPTATSTTNPETSTDKITYQYKVKGADDDAYTDTVPTNAGEYTVKATFPANKNYGVTTATANFTIAEKTLTATITAKNKTYDGTNTAEVTEVTLTGMVNDETVTATASDAKFAGVNASNNQTVTATITLKDPTGAAKNYTVATTATGKANITAKTLTVTATAQDKTYDGNDTATVNATLDTSGVVAGDEVTLVTTGVTASFNNKDAGQNKSVTLNGDYTLSGAAAGNYTLTQPSELKADINKKALTIKDLAVAEKTYDGTNKATISGTPTLDGVVGTENVTLVNGIPTFSSVNVGEDITINFTNFSITGDAAGNYMLTQPSGITANINAYNATGNEYTTTTKDWTNQDFVVMANEGWKVSEANTAEGTWSDTLTRSTETGNTSGSMTFYVKNTNSGIISEAITETYKIDKTSPTGEISIDERNKWETFLNTISFNLFYKDKQSVTLTSNDASSGVRTIEYLVTEDNLSIAQLADRNFSTYANAFGIEADAKLIVYAKLTDNAGNVTYLRSDGVVLDATVPVINGAEDEKTYCDAVTLTITDANLDRVTLNNTTATLTTDGKLALNPAEGTQTVVATDKAGNSTSITVTVKSGHTWGDWASNGNNTHTRTCCYNAAHTEEGDCTGGTATCKHRAVCEDCGDAHGELDPHNHANLKHVEAKAATTAAEGNIEYWYCDGCGKYYKDKDATEEITQDDTVRAKLEVKSKSAQTGDESSMTLLLVLTILTGAGVGTTTVLGKRKRYSK